jgi:hypothetical protein
MEEKRERGKEWEKSEERSIFEKMKQSWMWNFKCASEKLNCKVKKYFANQDSNLFFASFEDFRDFSTLMEFLVEYATMYGEYSWKFYSEKWKMICYRKVKRNSRRWREQVHWKSRCGVVTKCVLNYNLVLCS